MQLVDCVVAITHTWNEGRDDKLCTSGYNMDFVLCEMLNDY